ncbi:hypothetical protein EUGRSUZ_F03615 [Eucalyptus grandis]|uniref:Uncharacterized protein n=2 Tax=Eucalyptus grandis TaxID=71139 RepID=A0ACC3KLY2_EUCGR|nr:hypothetical protein EUGRSUZ_F03615 [Eucalyptus grandis]
MHHAIIMGTVALISSNCLEPYRFVLVTRFDQTGGKWPNLSQIFYGSNFPVGRQWGLDKNKIAIEIMPASMIW